MDRGGTFTDVIGLSPEGVLRVAKVLSSDDAGRHSGGEGQEREYEFLEPLEVSLLTQRRTVAPYELQGGADGAVGENLWKTAGSETYETLQSSDHREGKSGDRLLIRTPGGGGYGERG